MTKPGVQLDKQKNYAIATLMLTIVIEVMGFGLIFPLLSALFMPGKYSLISINTDLHTRYLLYSLAITLWPIGAFFGTPYLGELSDKYGRRRTLTICLSMTGVSYALSAVSITLRLPFLFFASRLISGFFCGSYDIAQAAAADISTPKNKARNMGWIALAASFGMIFGPLIAGFTSNGNYVLWFSITTPFWIAGGLAVGNAVLVMFLFRETYQITRKAHIHLSKIFSSFLFIFTDKRVRRLGVTFFFFNTGWCLFVTSMPLILNRYFHFNIEFTGLFFCFMGLGCVISILSVQKTLLKHFPLKNIYLSTVFISSLILIPSFLWPNLNGLWITAFFFALFEILCYSSILAMCSNAVTVDIQGKVMGGIGAITSITFIVAGVLLPCLADLNVLLLILAASITYLISCAIMLSIKPSKSEI